jgi:hypothetical protein
LLLLPPRDFCRDHVGRYPGGQGRPGCRWRRRAAPVTLAPIRARYCAARGRHAAGRRRFARR